MVDSMDELKSSRSVCGKDFPNFEMLDAKIAAALIKILQNFQFKKKVSLEEKKAQKEDRILRGRQVAFMIHDYFRVTGAHDTVLDYADLFSVTHHDDNIQEFDTRWDELLLSMSKIPSDDILESLYELRIRESAQLKNVLELYDMEIHQKIPVPNYQKLKSMVKRRLNIVFQPGCISELDLTRTTVGAELFHSVGYTHFLEHILNHESLQQLQEEQTLDQFWKFES